MKNIYLLLFLLLPVYSLAQQSNVVISGSTQDSTVKRIRIVKFSPLWRNDDSLFERQLAGDSLGLGETLKLTFDLAEPGPLSFVIQGLTAAIYVTPGDKINFSIIRENKRPKVVFRGPNAAHYSYASLSDDFIKENNAYPIFKKDKGTDVYKEELDRWLDLKIRFLEDFKKNNKVSVSFLNYAKNTIEFQYVNFIYGPLNTKEFSRAELPADYFTTSDSILRNSNNVIKYFSGVNLLAFTYKHIIFSSEDYLNNFDIAYNNVMTQFKGQTRAALLTNLIGIYAKQQKETYRDQLVKAITASRNIVRDTNFVNYINNREIEYTKLNQKFPDYLLNTTYLKKLNSNTNISLGNLLSSHSNEPIYVDFWASWCSPCRQDIAESAQSKEELKSKGVRILYISLDTKTNTSQWQKASQQDGVTEDQYILEGDFESPLARYLKTMSIPRYILLDKDHKLRSYNAPRLNTNNFPQLKAAVANIR